jgi:hypothetical protein
MEIEISQYVTLQINEYKGSYSLIEGQEKDGTFKPAFCKRKFGKDQVEKTAPLSVRIGDPASMHNLGESLMQYAKELGYVAK